LRNITHRLLRSAIWTDTRGQDLLEYALMAGFVSLLACAVMPGVAYTLSTIFGHITSVMDAVGSMGSGVAGS
jgi:pilus assembly protein Flp/PilA